MTPPDGQNWCRMVKGNLVEAMIQIRCTVLAVLAMFAIAPSGAVATPAGWSALVIGQPGAGADTAFADAYHMSRALSDGGIGGVRLLRDAPASEVSVALNALAGVERLVVYYAGPFDPAGKAMALRGGEITLAELLVDLAKGGTRQVALLVEDCAGQGQAAAGISAFDAPSDLELLVAASAGPDGVCPAASDRLTERLSRSVEMADGAFILQESLSGIWTTSTLTEPLTLTNASAPLPITQAGPIISVVSNDVVTLSPILTPVSASFSPINQAAASTPTAPHTAATGEAVVIFTAPDSAQIAALPSAAGLPEPSIIVGVIEGLTNAAFERAIEPGDVDSTEISYDNLVARQRLRSENKDLFDSLVSTGAFDPPEPLLGRALQSELARMGCYNAQVDGVWGGGSRASVERYFAEIAGESAETLEPTFGLFRQIIRKDDIACPAPVVVAAPVRTAAPRAQTANRPAAATQATPARRTPAAEPQAKPRQIQSGTTLGVFR